MNSFVNGPIFAIMQTTVAPEMRGHVFTLIGSLSGLMIAGPLADKFGVQSWFVIGGFVTLLMGVIGFFVPVIMNVEEDRSPMQAVELLESSLKTETAVSA